MNKLLRKAILRAEKKQNEADIALQAINQYLSFRDFECDDEPELSICSGDEIILEWHGWEINRNEIIDHMENKGFITPKDFYVLANSNQ